MKLACASSGKSEVTGKGLCPAVHTEETDDDDELLA